jgi:hypothetical protein
MTDQTSLPKVEEQPKTIQAPNVEKDISKDPVKYLAYLLDLMIKHESSDIYLTYNEEPTLRIF